MPALDTGVLSDIGASGPDITGSMAKGLTLSDLYDQSTLSKMNVNQAKQSQADMTYAKQILSGKDLSKLEDQNAAVAEITKRSPQLGMQLARGFSQAQADKAGNDLDQLKLYEVKNDVIGGAVVQLKTKHDALLAQGLNEQQIHDAMAGDVQQTLAQLTQAKLPNGQPLLSNEDRAAALKGLQNGYSTQFIDGLVQKSQQAKAVLAQKMKEHEEARKDKDEERKEKATDAAIALGSRRADQGDRKITDAEALASVKQKIAQEGKFDADDATALAQQYLAGDKSVMTGLGRGAQGAQNIIMVRHAIAQEAKAQGLKPADIAARLAEYQGYVSEQRTLGTSTANVQQAASEAGKMITNAREISNRVPRSEFLPWTKLSQMTDKQLNNPDLVALKGATTEVINTWARAINPKGVATVADKDHGYDLLNQAQSKEAYEAQLDQFEKAINASLAAPPEVREYLHDVFVGKIGGQTKTGEPSAIADPATTVVPAGIGPGADPAHRGGWGKATVVTP